VEEPNLKTSRSCWRWNKVKTVWCGTRLRESTILQRTIIQVTHLLSCERKTEDVQKTNCYWTCQPVRMGTTR